MPYAHPTVEHFAPLFVTLGAVAKPDEEPTFAIEGFAYGLSKRSFETTCPSTRTCPAMISARALSRDPASPRSMSATSRRIFFIECSVRL